MSACALRRWGSACSVQRPPDTPVAKEMEKSLQSMISERNKQDRLFLEKSLAKKLDTSSEVVINSIPPGNREGCTDR